MEYKNTFKLSFPSYSSNEAFARVAVSSFVTQTDPTIEELYDIKTAVSEAVTNCIVHAYRDTIGTVYIHASISNDNIVTIKIRDRGCGIEDVEKARQPLYSSIGGDERAGLGFSVMESFMDKVSVKSIMGKGTTVIMKKRIKLRTKHA